ncbi:MAG: thiolase domain-containing protein [Chloroflexi bacterium]|nr:thiolase domain-containing protein [Chloroflexota bacterium]
MRNVSIIGIGQTPVGEIWEKGLRTLAVDAIRAAMKDAHMETADALYIGNMLSGEATGQAHLGPLIADAAGLRGVEAAKIEAACGSAAYALRLAYLAVAGGMHDTVIVCGVEKMTDRAPGRMTNGLASAADGELEAAQGLSFVAINALLMQRYMYEFGWKKSDFAQFAVNAHQNAAGNPYAMFHHLVSANDFEKAKMVATPINLLDSSPMADGAAAVVITSDPLAREFADKPVRIKASTAATDSIAIAERRDILTLDAAKRSTLKAYEVAGVSPADIDLFELHDAFSIMAALSLEAAGFAERGQGVRLALTQDIGIEGKHPISTMGGLKGRGHPVGATGLYQVVEAAMQLRGEAGHNQVQDARLAMTQNIGGSGATVTTHILEAWR